MAEFGNRGVRNKDYVFVDGDYLTPDGVRERFDIIRDKVFDQPYRQRPLFKESSNVPNPQRLTETERYRLDNEDYDLEEPGEDIRIKSNYQYYQYMILALNNNLTRLRNERRGVLHTKGEIEIEYHRLYAAENAARGKEMGTSDKARAAWMRHNYPALVEISELYKFFLDEVDNECETLAANQANLSRAITAAEDDSRERGTFAFGNAIDRAR